jgi:transcription initiation factor TFIID subunit 7
MLIVESPISEESHMVEETKFHSNFNTEEFVFPHGITPPMHFVRKRRFRPRLNARVNEIHSFSHATHH